MTIERTNRRKEEEFRMALKRDCKGVLGKEPTCKWKGPVSESLACGR
jgi:hypothetical protein